MAFFIHRKITNNKLYTLETLVQGIKFVDYRSSSSETPTPEPTPGPDPTPSGEIFPKNFAPGGYRLKDGTYVTYNDITDSQISQVDSIYIGDDNDNNHLFVTAESLLNTNTYAFSTSATLPDVFQTSDFYTSNQTVTGIPGKIFACCPPFNTQGTVNSVTVDWGGLDNTDSWCSLIETYNLNLSDYPALKYAAEHTGYIMGGGEAQLFVTNHDAIWASYTKLTGNNSGIYAWESSFGFQVSSAKSNQQGLRFYPSDSNVDRPTSLDTPRRVLLLTSIQSDASR